HLVKPAAGAVSAGYAVGRWLADLAPRLAGSDADLLVHAGAGARRRAARLRAGHSGGSHRGGAAGSERAAAVAAGLSCRAGLPAFSTLFAGAAGDAGAGAARYRAAARAVAAHPARALFDPSFLSPAVA